MKHILTNLKRVEIESCPKCKNKVFSVYEVEIKDDGGWIACETCGEKRYPVAMIETMSDLDFYSPTPEEEAEYERYMADYESNYFQDDPGDIYHPILK